MIFCTYLDIVSIFYNEFWSVYGKNTGEGGKFFDRELYDYGVVWLSSKTYFFSINSLPAFHA